MDGCDAGVGLGGDNREPSVLLDGREQERTGAGHAEAVLAADGPAGLLADGFLGGVALMCLVKPNFRL